MTPLTCVTSSFQTPPSALKSTLSPILLKPSVRVLVAEFAHYNTMLNSLVLFISFLSFCNILLFNVLLTFFFLGFLEARNEMHQCTRTITYHLCFNPFSGAFTHINTEELNSVSGRCTDSVSTKKGIISITIIFTFYY